MMNAQKTLPTPVRQARCPSCNKRGQFSFLGEQIWPKRVVEATGIAPTLRLWRCLHCDSTISEPNLLPYKD